MSEAGMWPHSPTRRSENAQDSSDSAWSMPEENSRVMDSEQATLTSTSSKHTSSPPPYGFGKSLPKTTKHHTVHAYIHMLHDQGVQWGSGGAELTDAASQPSPDSGPPLRLCLGRRLQPHVWYSSVLLVSLTHLGPSSQPPPPPPAAIIPQIHCENPYSACVDSIDA